MGLEAQSVGGQQLMLDQALGWGGGGEMQRNHD